MKTINKKEVEDLIKYATGQDYCAEDKSYRLLPEEFFNETRLQRILGLAEWFYVSEGFDCDNFADKLRQQVKDRYWKKYVRGAGSKNGVNSVPDVFIECVKVMYPGARLPHWFVCAVCDDGNGNPKLIYRERTTTNIVEPKQGYSFIRIK